LQGGTDRTADPILTNTVFRAVHVTLSLKLGDHEGLAVFVHGRLLQRTLLAVLPAILIQIPIRALPSPVPAYQRIRSGISRCLPAAASAGKLRVGVVCFALFLLLLIVVVLLLKLF